MQKNVEYHVSYYFDQARGKKRKIGWFPANYVKLLAGSARNTPAETGTNLAVSPQPSVSGLLMK